MKAFEFDSDVLPAGDRLAAFRSAAGDFIVDPVGDTRFRTRWTLLKLGDVNAICSEVTPVRYRRTRTMIEADGQDRVAVHCYVEGGAEGHLDGRPVEVGPGGAMVWDLSRTIDCRSTGAASLLIVTLPRFMLDDVFAVPSYSCALDPSVELALATGHLQFLLSRPGNIPEGASAHLAHSVRDLLAAAMLPALEGAAMAGSDPNASLLQRLCRVIDACPAAIVDAEGLSATLETPVEQIRRAVVREGGIQRLVERRRLLASYRALCDPADTSSISAIAYRCGIPDPPRFTHSFTAMFGSGPREVRRRAQGDLPRWAGAYPVEDTYSSFLKKGS